MQDENELVIKWRVQPQEPIIEQQTQLLWDSCVSASIAMMLGINQQLVVDEFHTQYMAHEIEESDYLESKGLKFELHYTKTNSKDLVSDRVYLLAVPSLNIKGIVHSIVAHTFIDTDGSLKWYIYDPNYGYEGREVYTGSESFFSWFATLSVSVEDLLNWRSANIMEA